MKAKERRAKLMEELEGCLGLGEGNSVTYFQKRPYTMVKVKLFFKGAPYAGLGFTKVNYPDVWNPEYGLELATTKALKHITRQVLA